MKPNGKDCIHEPVLHSRSKEDDGYPWRRSWYARCSDYGLTVGYYETAEEAVRYWYTCYGESTLSFDRDLQPESVMDQDE